MISAVAYKTKQFLPVLIKLGLVVSAFYFIYFELANNNHLTWNEYKRISRRFSTISLICLLLLSLINWLIEIQKWKILAHHVSNISFNQAAAQTLAALATSLPTPNRIGDYGAKAMYYPKHCRKKIVFLNLIGNMAQMTTTTIFGTVGMLYTIYFFQSHYNYRSFLLGLTGLGTVFFLLVVILQHRRLYRLKKRINKWLMLVLKLPRKSYLKVLCCALLRYLIFSFQFYYLLILFGAEIEFITAFATISIMHLLSSIIPSIFLADVLIKGSVALYVFELLGVHGSIVLSVVTLMWLFNFVAPSLVGSYYVLTFKLPKPVS